MWPVVRIIMRLSRRRWDEMGMMMLVVMRYDEI